MSPQLAARGVCGEEVITSRPSPIRQVEGKPQAELRALWALEELISKFEVKPNQKSESGRQRFASATLLTGSLRLYRALP